MSDVNRMRVLIVFQLTAVALAGLGSRSWGPDRVAPRWVEPAGATAFVWFEASLFVFLVLLLRSSISGSRRWILIGVECAIVWAAFLVALPSVQ
jgi:hypothetical protein